VIKIVVDGQRYQYSADDIRFIVEEARRAGVKVAAHAQTERGARAAIEAGVASIEHGWVMTDEDLALAKQKGVALVSTDFTVAQLIADGMEPEAAKRTHEKYVARLKRAWAAGVDVVFGTDVMSDVKGRTRGAMAMEYVDSFKEAGIGAPGILRAMTSRAAVLLGVEKERGAIRAGMAADLVATPMNPLRDIDGLKSINFVMKDGRVVVRH
jgi:imidazolonepropionase-like amidohydrolase